MLAGVASPKYLPRLLCKLYQGVGDKVRSLCRETLAPLSTRYLLDSSPSPNTAWTYRPITVDNMRLINRGSFSAVETNYRSTWSLRVRFQRSSKSGSEGQREGSGYFSHLAFSFR